MTQPPPAQTIHPVCAACLHKMTDHGDRALGICSAGVYPNDCDCTGIK